MAIDPRATPPTRRDDDVRNPRYDNDVTTPRRNTGGMAFAVLLTIVVIAIAAWMIANDGEGGTTGDTTSPTETTLPAETTVPADTPTTVAP
ncbi:MAG: hypothetical protein WD990_02425 [Acidimicrobiia bacterium]